tara:strand:+ start:45 stop:1424 length:1380 start_codon:yes stop_codon:yes gene_type:complete
MQWPVVLDNPSAIDIFNFTGVIEPFTLRKTIAGTSTFIGNHFDPEPHSVKGSVFSGERQTGFYRASFKSSNFYDINDSKMLPFEHITDTTGLGDLASHVAPVSFVADITSSAPPFVETTPLQEIFDLTKNPEIAQFYSYNTSVYGSKTYSLLDGFDAGVWPNIYQSPLTSSLMGWWRLNEDVSTSGNVTDSSGNGNPGTFSEGGYTWDRPEFSGSLSPSSYIQEGSCGFSATAGDDTGMSVGDVSIWRPLVGDTGTSRVTISAWIYWADGNSTVGRVVQFGVYQYLYVSSHAALRGRITFTTRWDGSSVSWDSTRNCAEQTWTHIVATYDARDAANDPVFYINGVKVGATNDGSAPTGAWGAWPGAGDVTIGSDYNASNGFTGNMADVAIWNAILTHDQVRALYEAYRGVFIRSSGQLLATGSGILGRPAATSRSAAVGFTYDNSEIGIDSLAFGGLLK